MMRRRVVVSGHVQGVFFRATCADAAQVAGVAGWVANQPDGTVEAVFEGTPEAVDAMLRWCHEGPPNAVVDAVDVTEQDPVGETDFVAR